MSGWSLSKGACVLLDFNSCACRLSCFPSAALASLAPLPHPLRPIVALAPYVARHSLRCLRAQTNTALVAFKTGNVVLRAVRGRKRLITLPRGLC